TPSEPSRRRVVIRPTTKQKAVGVVTLVALAGTVPLVLANTLLAVVAFVPFLIFGIWWMVLEAARETKMRHANREYDAEVAALRAEARRRGKEWESRLASAQEHARHQHEKGLQTWKLLAASFNDELTKRKGVRDEAGQRLRAAEANWATAGSQYASAFQSKK